MQVVELLRCVRLNDQYPLILALDGQEAFARDLVLGYLFCVAIGGKNKVAWVKRRLHLYAAVGNL